MNRKLLGGVCGLVGILISIAWIAGGIAVAPNFSITQNWISDLAGIGFTSIIRPDVTTPTTQLIFGVGIFVTGLTSVVFALGLLSDANDSIMSRKTLYRHGAQILLIGMVATIFVGFFPATVLSGVAHMGFAVVSFACMIAATFVIGIAFLPRSVSAPRSTYLGGFSIIMAVTMLLGISQFYTLKGLGELILIASQEAWVLVMSVRLLRQAEK
jgi:hypothetical membrane protein